MQNSEEEHINKYETKYLLKRFISFYAPHKALLALDMLTGFLQAGFKILIPLCVHQILKEHLPQENYRVVVIFIFTVFLLAALAAFANYLNVKWGHILGTRIETDMRGDLFRHLQKLSFSYFDNTKTGHIVSRISNDLFTVSEIAHHGPEDLFISLCTISGAFAIMFCINPQLALVALIPLPFLFGWGMIYRKKMRNSYRHIRKRIADINSSVENSIQGIREVKSFANEELEISRFDDVNSEFRYAKEKMYSVMAGFHAGMMFIIHSYRLIIIAGAAVLIASGSVDMIDLVTFLLFIPYIMEPVRRMVNFAEQFQQGAASFERFIEVMDTEPEIQDAENAVALDTVKGNIILENISFRYSPETDDILKNINMEVKEGQTVALVGESGAGKTSLAALIPRFYEPQKGKLLIDGHDIMNLKQTFLRDSIGIVRQASFMFDSSIADNILFGSPTATKEEMIEAARSANILDFIESLPDGFDSMVGEHGVKLSGGQKQRLSIARVFLKNPQILIFDEATSSLDTESESLIHQSMEKLCKNRTTIIIAHRLSTIKNADIIYVLKKGKIVESGNHDKLIAKKGSYYKLHTAQL